MTGNAIQTSAEWHRMSKNVFNVGIFPQSRPMSPTINSITTTVVNGETSSNSW